MARPFWSGQVQISLMSFVKLSPARSEKKPPTRAAAAKAQEKSGKHGLTLLHINAKSADKRRKSA